MSKIFIGIPTIRRYEPFWDSMAKFIPELKHNFEVEVCTVHGKPVSEARNIIADRFMDSDCDYLLFLDDDHEGHTISMFESILDPILNNNSYMCGLKCYTKRFPYNSNILIYSEIDEEKLGIPKGSGKYIPIDLNNGYMYVHLIGFGMTILTKWAFRIIEKPYFVSEFLNGKLVKEDNYFCDKLVKVGIQPVGCFNYTLSHNGIGSHNAIRMREEGMSKIKEKNPDLKVLVA